MWFCIITSLCCSCGFICSHIYDLIFRKTPDVCNEIIFFFSLKHVSHAVGFTPLSCTVQELALTLVQPSQLIPGLFTPQGSPGPVSTTLPAPGPRCTCPLSLSICLSPPPQTPLHSPASCLWCCLLCAFLGTGSHTGCGRLRLAPP